jgi:hypothetical protein
LSAVRVLTTLFRPLAHRLAFLTAQPARHHDVDVKVKIPASAAAAHRQSGPSHEQHLTRLDSGGDLDLVLATTERWDADTAAEYRSRHRDADPRVQRAAVAHHRRMSGDLHLDVKIPGASTLPSRFPLTLLWNAVAVLEPGRDVDVELS